MSDINVARAGEFFIYSLWLQGQMADLIVLKKHPELVPEFVKSPSTIPAGMSEKRAHYWEKSFSAVMAEFLKLFEHLLSSEQIIDLKSIYFLRNAIAHSHVSLARDYFLYRPWGGEKQEAEIIKALDLKPLENQSNPLMLKLSFHDDRRYLFEFDRIKRLDEICFETVAMDVGIPHSRIR